MNKYIYIYIWWHTSNILCAFILPCLIANPTNTLSSFIIPTLPIFSVLSLYLIYCQPYQNSQYFDFTLFIANPTNTFSAFILSSSIATLPILSVLLLYLVSAFIRQVKLRLFTAKSHARRFSHHLKVHCLVWLDTDH